MKTNETKENEVIESEAKVSFQETEKGKLMFIHDEEVAKKYSQLMETMGRYMKKKKKEIINLLCDEVDVQIFCNILPKEEEE